MKNLIFLIPFSPPYDVYKTLPEENSWITENGKVVHIFGYDFGDLFLKALTQYYADYNCEIWQPDLVADKIYTAQLQERVIHRNFPAKKIKVFKRYKFFEDIYSNEILKWAKRYDGKDTIFMLPIIPERLIEKKIIISLKQSKVLYYNFLNSERILPSKVNTLNPLKRINRLLINYNKMKWLKKVKNLLSVNDNPKAQEKLKIMIPNINIFLFRTGLDCDYWRPVVDKVEARRILNIPQDSFVILLSQRLVPEYQVDKFIECLTKVKAEREFICYITGHGTLEYESYLNELVIKHKLEEKVHFVGYVEDDVLRNYFIAADLFVTVPYMFAGSYGATKCTAIGTPILHVTMGGSYEFLKKHNAGEFVSPYNYEEWSKKLEDIINGKIKVKTVPREEVVNYYSWKRTADDLHYALMNLK
jgi:glycosyltransferase involved in cell wall biosynthesis